jgi:hypothetical protein
MHVVPTVPMPAPTRPNWRPLVGNVDGIMLLPYFPRGSLDRAIAVLNKKLRRKATSERYRRLGWREEYLWRVFHCRKWSSAKVTAPRAGLLSGFPPIIFSVFPHVKIADLACLSFGSSQS